MTAVPAPGAVPPGLPAAGAPPTGRWGAARRAAGRFGTAGAGWGAALALAVAVPCVAGTTWDTELTVAALYGIVAISMALLVFGLRVVSLGQQALVAAGAFTLANVAGRGGLPFWPSLALAGLLGGAAAMVIGLVALRVSTMSLALLTLVVGVAAQASVFQLPSLLGGGSGQAAPRPGIAQGGLGFYFVVLAVLVVVVYVDRRLRRSKVGRAATAIGRSPRVAEAYGVSPLAYSVALFGVSGVVAGLAGGLWAGWQQVVTAQQWSYALGLAFLIMVVVTVVYRQSTLLVTAAFFAVFGYVLQQVRPLVDLLGATRLAELVPAAGSAMLLVFLVVGARREARPKERDLRPLVRETLATGPRQPPVPPVVARPARDGPPPAAGPLLAVDGLTVRFGGATAVDGASIEVAPRSMVGLVGPNGAGKTTLLNCVSGFQRYEAGTVRLRGRAIDRVAPERRARLGVARTFQNLGLVGTATVEDNLLLAQHGLAGYSAASALAGLPASRRRERELRARALDVLSLFHVGHLAPAPVRSLPYGLRKVVELAGAVVREPELLLLDEPSSGLSVDEGRALLETMAEAVGHLELSVLVVEHHVPLVNEFCRWVYVLDAGRVIAAGEPGEVHRRQAVVDAFLGAEVPT